MASYRHCLLRRHCKRAAGNGTMIVDLVCLSVFVLLFFISHFPADAAAHRLSSAPRRRGGVRGVEEDNHDSARCVFRLSLPLSRCLSLSPGTLFRRPCPIQFVFAPEDSSTQHGVPTEPARPSQRDPGHSGPPYSHANPPKHKCTATAGSRSGFFFQGTATLPGKKQHKGRSGLWG